jgi:hypothetical protein
MIVAKQFHSFDVAELNDGVLERPLAKFRQVAF